MAHAASAHCYGIPRHHHDCFRTAHAEWRGTRRHFTSGGVRQPCLWAQVQARNVRCCAGASPEISDGSTLPRNRSYFVTKEDDGHKAHIKIDGAFVYLGWYDTAEEAAKAASDASMYLRKAPVNSEVRAYNRELVRAALDEALIGVFRKSRRKPKTSRFKYVSKLRSGAYSAQVPNNKGVAVYIGQYTTEEEAAKAVDVTQVFQNREPVNFRADEYDSERIRASAATLDELIAGMRERRRKTETSRFRHVVKRSGTERFRAYVPVNQQQVHLGLYQVEEEAARATDAARLYLDLGAVNFPAEEYDVEEIKTSASSFDELVATMRRQAHTANIGVWNCDIQEYKGVWCACLQRNQTKIDLGSHTSRDAAARAVDRGLIFLGQEPQQFPDTQYDVPTIRASASNIKRFATQERKQADATHKSYRFGKFGSVRPSGKRFVAVVRNGGKQHHLGSFVTEEHALRALDKLLIYNGLNPIYFPAEQYHTQAIRSSAATVEDFIQQTRLAAQGL